MGFTDSKKEIPSLTIENASYWREVYFALKEYEQYTGKKVRNKNSGRVGVILRITASGSIQVLEKIEPYVVCTHNNWNTLELLEDEDTKEKNNFFGCVCYCPSDAGSGMSKCKLYDCECNYAGNEGCDCQMGEDIKEKKFDCPTDCDCVTCTKSSICTYKSCSDCEELGYGVPLHCCSDKNGER